MFSKDVDKLAVNHLASILYQLYQSFQKFRRLIEQVHRSQRLLAFRPIHQSSF